MSEERDVRHMASCGLPAERTPESCHPECPNRLWSTLQRIYDFHRAAPDDDRLCAEGCHGGWPCITRSEAADAVEMSLPELYGGAA